RRTSRRSSAWTVSCGSSWRGPSSACSPREPRACSRRSQRQRPSRISRSSPSRSPRSVSRTSSSSSRERRCGTDPMLAVFLKDLLMLRRDRGALFISIIVPILMITTIAEALHRNKDEIKMRVPVVDEDQGPVSKTFINLLAEHADVQLVSRAEAEAIVRDQNKAAAAILFPEHTSKDYLQGKTVQILLLTDPAQSTDIEQVKVMLLLMDNRAAALADPLAEERMSLKEVSLTANRNDINAFEQTVPGYALMFVLLAVIFGTAMAMHDERGWGTLPRLL